LLAFMSLQRHAVVKLRMRTPCAVLKPLALLLYRSLDWAAEPSSRCLHPAYDAEVARTPRSARRAGNVQTPFEAAVQQEAERAGEAPGGLVSDEEMAWRLHQELNARSPVLRTRSRKHSETGAPPSAAEVKEAAAPAPSKCSTGQQDGNAGEEQPPVAALPAVVAAAKPVKAKQPQQRSSSRVGKTAEAPTTVKEEETKSAKAAAAAVAAAAVAAVIKAEDGGKTAVLATKPTHGAGEGKSAAAALQQAAAAPLAEKSKPSKTKPAPSQPGIKPASDRPASKPALATDKGKDAGKAAKPLKIPRLPMVRHARKWYRCRVLKDAGDKVLMGECRAARLSHGPAWMPCRTWLLQCSGCASTALRGASAEGVTSTPSPAPGRILWHGG
jgi:hypothetical protein